MASVIDLFCHEPFDMGSIWTNANTTLSVSHSIFDDFPDEVFSGGNEGDPADFGSGNQLTAPLLDADYRPVLGGPAVDHGVELGSDYPLYDMEGNDRVQGSAPDVGPFEL